MNKKYFLTTVFVILVLTVGSAHAVSYDIPLVKKELNDSPENIKKGAMVALNVCVLCHDLKYIKYLNLMEIDFTQSEVDRLRGDRAFDAPILSTTSPEVSQKIFGMQPPDLSLMAKARKNGPHYIYTLLTSYEESAEGKIDNKLFPGIKMPDPLAYSVRNEETLRKEIEQKVESVTVFLEWASDPRARERRTMGYYVIAYLFVLTFLLYLVKRRVWKGIK